MGSDLRVELVTGFFRRIQQLLTVKNIERIPKVFEQLSLITQPYHRSRPERALHIQSKHLSSSLLFIMENERWL